MFPRNSCFSSYSIGIVTKDKDRWSDIIYVWPVEELPYASGNVSSASYKTGGKNVITAKWVPMGQSNRMTSPDVVSGEHVMIYRFADTDEYYWETMHREPELRRLETVLYAYGNLKKKGKAFTKEDSTYYFEVSTHDGHIHLHTTRSNEEKVSYDILVSTRESHIIIKDSLDNMIKLDSIKADFDVKTNHDIQLRAANDINIMADRDCNLRTGRDFNIRTGRDQTVRNDRDYLKQTDRNIRTKANGSSRHRADKLYRTSSGSHTRLSADKIMFVEGCEDLVLAGTCSTDSFDSDMPNYEGNVDTETSINIKQRQDIHMKARRDYIKDIKNDKIERVASAIKTTVPAMINNIGNALTNNAPYIQNNVPQVFYSGIVRASSFTSN